MMKWNYLNNEGEWVEDDFTFLQILPDLIPIILIWGGFLFFMFGLYFEFFIIP